MHESFDDDGDEEEFYSCAVEDLGLVIRALIDENPLLEDQDLGSLLSRFIKTFEKDKVDGRYVFALNQVQDLIAVYIKEVLDNTLMDMTSRGLIDMTVTEDGEFAWFLNESQRASYEDEFNI